MNTEIDMWILSQRLDEWFPTRRTCSPGDTWKIEENKQMSKISNWCKDLKYI